MPTINELYADAAFSGVSAQTKTDICATIGLDVTAAQEEVEESKFTQEELQQALHYLLAREAKAKPQVRRLLTLDDSISDVSGTFDPFYFRNNDPLLTYLLLDNLAHGSHHQGGELNLGGGGDRCSEDTVAIACCLAVACGAACCCGFCINQAYSSPESPTVQNTKVMLATLVGIAGFIVMFYYMLTHDVGKEAAKENDIDTEAYGFCLFLAAVAAGCLTTGSILTITNFLLPDCLPSTNIPKPSKKILAALNELKTIETLLDKGWSREGDDVLQCDQFIREVIKAYIQKIAEPKIVVVVEPSHTRSRSLFFPQYNSGALLSSSIVNRPEGDSLIVPSAPAYGT